mmetsp:Transcript_8028/g.21271  ORF Transcript_8028/g.21271 Transcript_8028/m.21271 type:complete len:94 (-) Transcript_8028:30-311(-)
MSNLRAPQSHSSAALLRGVKLELSCRWFGAHEISRFARVLRGMAPAVAQRSSMPEAIRLRTPRKPRFFGSRTDFRIEADVHAFAAWRSPADQT